MSEQQTKLWFKRRRYGWGWTPVTWQGWASLVVFVLVVVALPLVILPMHGNDVSTQELVLCVVFAISAIFILIGICYAKGPVPHWRWGKKPNDDSDQDY